MCSGHIQSVLESIQLNTPCCCCCISLTNEIHFKHFEHIQTDSDRFRQVFSISRVETLKRDIS